MYSEAIFTAAHSAAISLIESGAYTTPNDTVCSVETASGKIYTGISRTDVNVPIHAELDAIRKMQASGEVIIRTIFLINTHTRKPLLPCNNCLDLILALAPENINCEIMMHDRTISIKEVGLYAAPSCKGNSTQFDTTADNSKKSSTTHALAASAQRSATTRRSAAHAATSASVSIAETNEASAEVGANNKNPKRRVVKRVITDMIWREDEDDIDEFLRSLPSPTKHTGFFKR